MESLESRKEKDNKRRLESLQQRSETVRSQQNLIKLALSSVDQNAVKSRKIVFSDDNEDEPSAQNIQPETKVKNKREKKAKKQKTESKEKSVKLFDDDDEDNGEISSEQFRVRPQFEGEEGRRLLDLQSRFGNDQRFQLDERFAEDFGQTTKENNKSDNNDTDDNDNNDISEEKQRQLAILQSVCPTDPVPVVKEQLKLKQSSFVRFDPSTKDHTKFERKDDGVAHDSQRKGKDKNKKMVKEAEENAEVVLPEVSAERYYETAENLKGMFQNKSDTQQRFSLRGLFQNDQEENEEMDVEEDENEAFPSVQTTTTFSAPKEAKRTETQEKKPETQNYWKNSGMWKEPFFFTESDSRFYDGMDFLRNGTNDSVYNDRNKWNDFRERLVRFYKNKMRRAASFSTGPKPVHSAEVPDFNSAPYNPQQQTDSQVGRKKQPARKFHVRTRKMGVPENV